MYERVAIPYQSCSEGRQVGTRGPDCGHVLVFDNRRGNKPGRFRGFLYQWPRVYWRRWLGLPWAYRIPVYRILGSGGY